MSSFLRGLLFRSVICVCLVSCVAFWHYELCRYCHDSRSVSVKVSPCPRLSAGAGVSGWALLPLVTLPSWPPELSRVLQFKHNLIVGGETKFKHQFKIVSFKRFFNCKSNSRHFMRGKGAIIKILCMSIHVCQCKNWRTLVLRFKRTLGITRLRWFMAINHMETQKKGCLWPKSKRSFFLNYENNYYSVGWNRERIKSFKEILIKSLRP